MKSPLNVLVGKCLSEARTNRGFTDDLVLSNALGVTTSHWRLIESGANPCPVSATRTLADLMNWDFARVAELLTAVNHADVRKSGERKIDADSVKDRLEELRRLPGNLSDVWDWCFKRLSEATSAEKRTEDQRGFDFESAPNFSEKRDRLLDYLARSDSGGADLLTELGAKNVGHQRLPLYFRSILSGIRSSLERTELRLRNAVPVINGAEGFNLLHADYRKEIRSCEAFLCDPPNKESWENTKLDIRFLWNGHEPAPELKNKISLHVRSDQDMEGLKKAINKTLHSKRPSSLKGRKLEDYVSILPRRDSPANLFAYNFATRQARLVKPDAPRSNDEIVLHNAWFFDVGPMGRFCTLDNYREMNGNQGHTKNDLEFYAVFLQEEAALNLRESLLKNAL